MGVRGPIRERAVCKEGEECLGSAVFLWGMVGWG